MNMPCEQIGQIGPTASASCMNDWSEETDQLDVQHITNRLLGSGVVPAKYIGYERPNAVALYLQQQADDEHVCALLRARKPV